jgi:hypothetical protein
MAQCFLLRCSLKGMEQCGKRGEFDLVWRVRGAFIEK